MKIATVLFVYQRSWHTRQVLDGLRRGSVLPNPLIVFQDGIQAETRCDEWDKVHELVERIDFCETHIFTRTAHLGLAQSILCGMEEIFRSYDAAIVMEDDCVPAEGFMRFMQQGLETYENVQKIYSISGYAWPLNISSCMEHDAYFTGRISSWGWGTWKNRWKNCRDDASILSRIKGNKEASWRLATWGNDLEKMLLQTVRGLNDSWAVYWALHVIEMGGLCVNPYHSLLRNIGFDGTGTNCGNEGRKHNPIEEREKECYSFPTKLEINTTVQKVFSELYGSYTVNNVSNAKKIVIVYGAGNIFWEYEKEINEKWFIRAFVDRNKKGYLSGKPIILPEDLHKFTEEKILLMIGDVREMMHVAKTLHSKYSISPERIILGTNVYKHPYLRKITEFYLTDANLFHITIEGTDIEVSTWDELVNAYDVLGNEIYSYFINNAKNDIIFDVGINIGAASLYFLKSKKTKKIYGYEPFYPSFARAKRNLRKCLTSGARIEMEPYGLSDKDEKKTVMYYPEMSCGMSCDENMQVNAQNYYTSLYLLKKDECHEEQVCLRRTSEVFLPIMDAHPECNFVLKLDCEGGEYAIIKDLFLPGILSRFSFIMMEWHYRGSDALLRQLKQAGFSYWLQGKSEEMGLIYAYKHQC